MKKLTKIEAISVLVLFAILCVVSIVYMKGKTPPGQNGQMNGNSSQNIPKMSTISVAEKTPYVVISGDYPQFDTVDPLFNTAIRETIQTAITEHKTISQENWNARRDTATPAEKKLLPVTPAEEDLFPFFVKTEIVTLSPKLISVLIHYGGFQGGAHGFENAVTFNYDVTNNKQLTLADAFPNDPLYLNKVSDFAKKDLVAQFEKKADASMPAEDRVQYLENIKGMIEEGAAPTVENFSRFTISENGLTFYFGQYQVAPYVEGEQKVVVPFR